MSSDSLTYVKASCLCKNNEFLVPLTTASLPQATDICHCSTCRHITGQLAVHCAIAASAPLAIAEGDDTPTTLADLSNLSTYNATPALTRYFCHTCGAYMLYRFNKSDDKPLWMVSAGSLERTEGIVKAGYHTYIKDTKDGGLSKHYRSLNGTEIPRYAEEEHKATLPINWKDDSLSALQEQNVNTRHAHCHCRNISLHFTRPNVEESKDPSKWWLVPGADDSKPSRFIAGHCFCNSCRLSTGALVPNFIIIPRAHVFDDHSSDPTSSSPITLSKSSPTRIKNLTQYNSSPNTYREFCSTCGATAFFWTKAKGKTPFPQDDTSDESIIIDIGAGLLDEKEGGALAEDWLVWHSEVMHIGDALDKEVARAIEEGSKLAAKGA